MKHYYLRHFAVSAFLMMTALSATAQTPVIDSNYRYVRGATMNFVRMVYKSNNATVTERGVCCSEAEMPTVEDIKANQSTQLTNKGPIYWLKDLKPGTKYYMRGFVITQDGKTVYGEPMKFYTLPMGQINLTVREGGDAATYNRIKTASETALYWWNNLTEMKDFHPSVGFVDGTPTADCSYGGWVRVGSNQSYQRCGTIMHEWLHGVGVIPWANTEWSRTGRLRSGVNGDGYGTGQWLGDRVTEVLTFLENTETHLNGDYQHMWPYGINGASEDNGSDLLYIGNSLVCQALGEDGLQHTSTCFAQPYYALNQEDDTKFYIKNESQDRGRYTTFLMPKAEGGLRLVEMSSEDALKNDSAAWTTTFTPSNQFYQIRNVATGQYITFTGSAFTTTKRTSISANENLQLMKGRVDVDGQRGYWIIQPAANWEPKCINAFPNGNVNAQTFNISNDAESQRWLILTADQIKDIETIAVEKMKTDIASLLKQAKDLMNVPHKEDVEGADTDFETLLSNIEARAEQAASPTVLLAITEEAKKAGLQFLAKVTVTNPATPFNLTYLMVNPSIDNNTEGWTPSATVNYSCAEFYQATFDFKQEISGLPAGTYRLNMQGFQRPGSSTDSYNNYISGKNDVNAELYAGEKAEKIAHIAKGARTSSIGGGTEAKIGSVYIPNNMEAASLYFKKNLYDNQVYGALSEEGTLTVGLRSTSMPSNYWVIFDNFRLYFYGKVTEEEILGVDAITANNNDRPRKIFTIDGRQLSPNVSLRSGLYIIDGKKVVIK
ncbi:MAG: hypothetical protein IJ081_02985 [Prevotella sp.]|nr:hypothetical protein [Prevotella sp.]